MNGGWTGGHAAWFRVPEGCQWVKVVGGCEGDTETRPLIYRDSLRQGEPNRCDTLT